MDNCKLKIGKAELPLGLILAPMAGFTDRAMRLVCHECGAEYSVTEMVSAKAVIYGDKKTFRLARIGSDEGNVAIQLFGNDPEIMARAAAIMSEWEGDGDSSRPVAIDVNMGCPVPKVFGNGEGSALMRDPSLIERIVRAVKSATPLPCTVKLRAGIDSEHKNAVECALRAESGGADAVAIHGRTRKEMYSGRADREIIRKVKESLHIPVIANGDVTSAEEALAMLRDTGADGLMVGRGAIGNPFLFREITSGLLRESYTPPTPDERRRVALRQLEIAIADKGEGVAVRESRKQIAQYVRTFRGAAKIRAAINRAESFDEVKEAMLLAEAYAEEDGDSQ